VWKEIFLGEEKQGFLRGTYKNYKKNGRHPQTSNFKTTNAVPASIHKRQKS